MSYNIAELYRRYPRLQATEESISKAFSLLKKSIGSGGKILLCGNGGSAADSEHMAGELLKSYLIKRGADGGFAGKLLELYGEEEGGRISKGLQKAFKVISLCGHPSFSTAYINDVDPLMVFAQQVYVYGEPGDVLVAFSTSGNAENVLNAMKVARAAGLKTILFTGAAGGKCAEFADCALMMPEKETYKVQELHLPVYHAICAMLEEHFFGEGGNV